MEEIKGGVHLNPSILQEADRQIRVKNELQHKVLNHSFITKPPSWILRSGISLIAFVIIAILGLSYFIKYPDKISAKGSLSAYQPPLEHFVKKAGVIKHLYYQDEDTIAKGKTIAYIDNIANPQDIEKLKYFMVKYEETNNVLDYGRLAIPHKLNVGDITPTYNNFVLEVQRFQATLKEAGVYQKIKTLKSEIITNKKLMDVIETDKKYTEDELVLIEKDFNRNASLNKEGVISDLDKEKSKGQLIQHQKTYNQTNQSLLQNQIKEKQLSFEITKLSEERALKIKEHIFTIKSIMNKLYTDIVTWEDLYLVKAKISGIVSMKSDVVADKYITQEEVIATLLPSVKQEDRFVKVTVPSQGIGKIARGNRAVLKFDAYPYKEYGMVNSKVLKIAMLPEKDDKGNSMYEVQLSLPNPIVTTFHKTITYQPSSTVNTDIITEEKNILERIFESFLDLVRNG